MNKKVPQVNRNIFYLFFSTIFLVSLLLFIKIFWPYLTPFVLALIFAMVFYPLFEFFLKIFHQRRALSSIITCAILVLLVLLPLAAFLGLVSKEAFDVFLWARDRLNTEAIQTFLTENIWISNRIESLENLLHLDLSPDQIKDQLGSIGKNVGLFIYGQVKKLFSNIFRVLFSFILFLFILFYFFLDGKNMIKRIGDLSPLSDRQETHILQKFREVGSAVFWGNLVSAFLQGLMGGLGFTLFGLGNGFLWGFIIALLSLIPAVGTLVVALPASGFLFIKGKLLLGVGFLVYQIIFSNLIDNVVKPKMIESRMRIHPLLVFFSILGGVQVFGLLGILYGPLIVTIFISIIEIYEADIIRTGKSPTSEGGSSDDCS